MTIPNLTTLAEAEHYAASQGVRLTASDREHIRKSQEAELQRLLSLKRSEQGNWLTRLVEGFNRFYPRFLESLIGVGDVLLTFTQTLIISFGVPLALLFLLIVEQQRVVHGILLFEVDPSTAAFAAWALVLLNLVLEFQIHYVEHQTGCMAEQEHHFSLRLWLEGAAYWLGLGDRWEAQLASPAKRYQNLLRLVTFSILALALAGGMRAVIAQTEGAWYEALVRVVTESNLSLMMTWLGGLLFAGAAVLSAQGLSRYVALRTVEVLENMASGQTQRQNEFQAELESVAAQYITAKVATAQVRQLQKDALGVATMEAPFPKNGQEHWLTE